jgi:chromosome segregation ATPase
MRYSIRDALTGKYTKVQWSNGMTIDNQTQETVSEQLPALRIEEDAQTMRSKLGVFVEGIMNLNKLVSDVAKLEDKVATLTRQVDVQNELLLAANKERDAAREEAKEAKQAARMAREAYEQVDTVRVNLEADLANTRTNLSQTEVFLSEARQDVNEKSYQLVELEKVKEDIREQRDTFREEARAERDAKLDAIRKVSELSDQLTTADLRFTATNDDLTNTRERLEVCTASAKDWREKQQATATDLDTAKIENGRLASKVASLEENVAALRAMNDRQRDRLEAIQGVFRS